MQWRVIVLKQFFNNTVYVRVRFNSLRIRHIEQKKELEVTATQAFSHQRLLVGSFTNAANTLREAMRKLVGRSLFQPSPVIVIQPLEKLEGGLTEVEERLLKEMALSAGARKVAVWAGHELTDAEVTAKAAAAK